jgi:hypothetical protein
MVLIKFHTEEFAIGYKNINWTSKRVIGSDTCQVSVKCIGSTTLIFLFFDDILKNIRVVPTKTQS